MLSHQRFILSLLFALLASMTVGAQTLDSLFNGYLTPISQPGGTSPNFSFQGLFTNALGQFSGLQAPNPPDRLVIITSTGGHCYELPVTSIVPGSIMSGTVNDPSGQLSGLPSGGAAIVQKSPSKGLMPTPSNASQNIKDCIHTFNLTILDTVTGSSVVQQLDTLAVHSINIDSIYSVTPDTIYLYFEGAVVDTIITAPQKVYVASNNVDSIRTVGDTLIVRNSDSSLDSFYNYTGDPYNTSLTVTDDTLRLLDAGGEVNVPTSAFGNAVDTVTLTMVQAVDATDSLAIHTYLREDGVTTWSDTVNVYAEVPVTGGTFGVANGSDRYANVDYEGTVPSISFSSSTWTVTVPVGCTVTGIWLSGTNADYNGSNELYFKFEGPGLNGNADRGSMRIPSIQKTDVSGWFFGNPGTGNGFVLDIDPAPSISVVGLGTPLAPSLTLRAQGMNSFNTYYFTIGRL